MPDAPPIATSDKWRNDDQQGEQIVTHRLSAFSTRLSAMLIGAITSTTGTERPAQEADCNENRQHDQRRHDAGCRLARGKVAEPHQHADGGGSDAGNRGLETRHLQQILVGKGGADHHDERAAQQRQQRDHRARSHRAGAGRYRPQGCWNSLREARG